MYTPGSYGGYEGVHLTSQVKSITQNITRLQFSGNLVQLLPHAKYQNKKNLGQVALKI